MNDHIETIQYRQEMLARKRQEAPKRIHDLVRAEVDDAKARLIAAVQEAHRAGYTISDITKTTGISRPTVRKYIRGAGS